MSAIEDKARKLYTQNTANDPVIHCNRFPLWEELDEQVKHEWITRAIHIMSREELKERPRKFE